MKNKFKLKLQIIDHPADKRFPSKASLTLRWKNRIYAKPLYLDYQYQDGDKELTPKHLASLFNGFAKLLENDGYLET